MRPIPYFRRPFGGFRALDDVRRLQAVAGDLLDRLVEHLVVVGRIDGERRRAGGHDREHVAFVNQVARDPLEEIANPPGIAEVEVQVVDDDEEDATGRVVPRPGRGQDDALLGRRRRRRQQVVHAAAVHQRERRDVLRHAIFQHLEVVLRQVGHELILAVADDRVHGDQIDVDPEGRLRALARPAPEPALGAARGRRLRAQHRRRQRQSCEHTKTKAVGQHGRIIRRLAGPDGSRQTQPLDRIEGDACGDWGGSCGV